MEHPSVKEGVTDTLYRYANEMVITQLNNCLLKDFEGQQLADKIMKISMLLFAVRI